MTVKRLGDHPVHLGRAGAMTSEPRFTDMRWYADYAARHEADGAEGRLVSEWTFTEDWQGWERHPAGGELVVCLSGRLTLHQEMRTAASSPRGSKLATMPSTRQASGIPRTSKGRPGRCSSRPAWARKTGRADPEDGVWRGVRGAQAAPEPPVTVLRPCFSFPNDGRDRLDGLFDEGKVRWSSSRPACSGRPGSRQWLAFSTWPALLRRQEPISEAIDDFVRIPSCCGP